MFWVTDRKGAAMPKSKTVVKWQKKSHAKNYRMEASD